MRTAAFVILAVLLLCPTWTGDTPAPRLRDDPQVSVTRVALDPEQPGRRRVGALTFLGGIHLQSEDRVFGGFSSMLVERDRFLLLSDIGIAFSFRMGADWRPRGLSFAALPAGPGSGWLRKHRDSETIVRDPATDRLWVSFEDANAIWRYSPDLARAEAEARPKAMRAWPQNGGAEAMVRLRDGRFLVFSEDERVAGQAGTRAVVAFDRDPTAPGVRSFVATYRPPLGYSPTDAVELPDGRLLLLNRSVSFRQGFTARLALVDLAGLKLGATIVAQELARFEAPLIHDNFEALAVTREGADTIVWIASDDNPPSWFQRALLLKFRLDLPNAKSPPSVRKAGVKP